MELTHVIFLKFLYRNSNFGLTLDNITYGASASVVQAALNDLPTLSGVTVTSTLTLSGSYQYNLTFSAAYGLILKLVWINMIIK